MAKIHSRKRTGSGGEKPLCPYCRDSVSEGAIVECKQCLTSYHNECVTSCVILGCAGSLVAKSSVAGPPIRLGLSGLSQGAKSGLGKGVKEESSGSGLSYLFLLCVSFALTLLLVAKADPSDMNSVVSVGVGGAVILSFVLMMLAGSASAQTSARARASRAPQSDDSPSKVTGSGLRRTQSVGSGASRSDGSQPDGLVGGEESMKDPNEEKPGPTNFYAKPNIAPPSRDSI
ncbi:MAG: PHD finger domain-containing protein [Planctomycetota bacterium]|nr:PHD finger domain-containing protein [Planctomycetota bacterium]